MFDQGQSTASPQFGTAEFKSSPAGDVCRVCGQALPGIYYRANRAMVCAGCVERVRVSGPKDSHTAFVRGFTFGFGGFLIGLIAYSTITILLQGFTIGYFSFGVGFIVGKAMMMGSKGIGGRRYQIAAAILTYAAVSISAVPISIYLHIKERPPAQIQEQRAGDSNSAPSTLGSSDSQASDGAASRTKPKIGFAEAVGLLVLLGLASPFLGFANPLWGIINIIILLVGIQIAWRLTRGAPRILIDGPFDNSKSLAR
jgi:hypothetical protein